MRSPDRPHWTDAVVRFRRDLTPEPGELVDTELLWSLRWLGTYGLATRGETPTWDLVQEKVAQLHRAGLPLEQQVAELSNFIDELTSEGAAERLLASLRTARERRQRPPRAGVPR